MSNEHDNPLDGLDIVSQAHRGKAFDPDDVVREFPLRSHDDRAAIIVQIDQGLDMMDAGADLRRYTRMTSLRERLNGLHRELRRAGR
jgi:hypothetical protein